MSLEIHTIQDFQGGAINQLTVSLVLDVEFARAQVVSPS